jgi:hypothetical protein
MKMMLIPALLLLSAAAQPTAPPARSAAPVGMADPSSRIASQREAMAALSFLDGQWRGTGTAYGTGFTQTERVGTLLNGTVRLVEGHASGADGTTYFNAFGIISWDPDRRAYSMRSHAMGYAGDFPLTVRPDGFSWEQPMGPGASIRYTATIANGEWHEVGDRVVPGAAPVRMFEMRVRRIGDSAWPAGGAVPR